MKTIKLDDLNLLNIGNSIQISGAIWSGNGKHFLCFFPDEFDDDEIVLLDMDIVNWKTFLRQTDIMETEILAHGDKGTIKAVIRKSQRQIDQRISWKVFQRDNYTCRYCGKTGIPLTVDHLVLWEEGGCSIEENLLTSCKKCNKTRGNMEYVDWLNSDKYNRIAKDLTDDIRLANEEIIDTLGTLPIRFHQISR